MKATFVFFLITACSVKTCVAEAMNYQLGLMEHLMDNYGRGFVRPVKDGKATTNIIFRCLLSELLEMNTKRQTLSVAAWLKMTWKDEFLAWNASEWGNITSLHIPTHAIWRPDLTLINNVHDDGTFTLPQHLDVIAYPDGSITWLSPAILKSSCHQKVKYFPYDTQECALQFGSWSADSGEINFFPEEGDDAVQDRFVEDGTWEFGDVVVERRLVNYPCCAKPYSELFYHLLFRRRHDFYVAYLIIPVVMLSILSLMVFYLPPESGEKLSLSITNLLALVVFDQLVSETIPPSADSNPLLAKYYETMIIMACISVALTVIVIRISLNTHQMPQWVEHLFLECIYKIVCPIGRDETDRIDSKDISNSCYDNHSTDLFSKQTPTTSNTDIAQNKRIGSGVASLSSEQCVRDESFPNEILNSQPSDGSLNNDVLNRMSANVNEIICYVRTLQVQSSASEAEEETVKKWKCLANVLDRCLFYIFSIIFCFTTLSIMLLIQIGAAADYSKQYKTWFKKSD